MTVTPPRHLEGSEAVARLRAWRNRGRQSGASYLRHWTIRSYSHSAVCVRLEWTMANGSMAGIERAGSTIEEAVDLVMEEFTATQGDDFPAATLPGHTHELGEAGA